MLTPCLIHNDLMGKVCINQIRERLKTVEERRRFYEWKSQQPRRLVLHEVWRHAYLARPYLIGAPNERVAERFRHIFMNVEEIGKTGKLQLVPLTETDEFVQVFTHMLEEFGARGAGIPGRLIESAREPIHRYFQHGTPIGVAMFAGYKAPAGPILVKYGKREFLEPMLQTGKLRLANATSYNSASYLDAVRDDETSRTFFIPTYQERVEGQTHVEMQGHRIEFNDDDIELPLVVDDYYLFSMCEQIHYRMPTDFEADAAIVIKNPERFKQCPIASLLARFPDWEPMEGKVTYYDLSRLHKIQSSGDGEVLRLRLSKGSSCRISAPPKDCRTPRAAVSVHRINDRLRGPSDVQVISLRGPRTNLGTGA